MTKADGGATPAGHPRFLQNQRNIFSEPTMPSFIASAFFSAALFTSPHDLEAYWRTAKPDAGSLVLVDTKSYRHCHNDRGKYVRCFKKDPRDPSRPEADQAFYRRDQDLRDRHHHDAKR